MLFNSWTFWFFFALVLPAYWLLPFRAQTLFLLAASYVFYGWWDWRFLPLIAFSTVMDFYLGNLVAEAPEGPPRQRFVRISVVVNLLLLGVFKYYNFFAHEVAGALRGLGLPVSLPFVELILPVGISFYTFQSMSYVFDIARGVTRPASNFWNFALYVPSFRIWSPDPSCDPEPKAKTRPAGACSSSSRFPGFGVTAISPPAFPTS